MYLSAFLSVCLHVCLYVCMYMCVCLYIYILFTYYRSAAIYAGNGYVNFGFTANFHTASFSKFSLLDNNLMLTSQGLTCKFRASCYSTCLSGCTLQTGLV